MKTLQKHLKSLENTLANLIDNAQNNNDNSYPYNEDISYHKNLISDLKTLINKHTPIHHTHTPNTTPIILLIPKFQPKTNHTRIQNLIPRTPTRQPQKQMYRITKLLLLLFIIINLYPYDAFLLSTSILLHLFVKSQKKWYFSYLLQCKQNKLTQHQEALNNYLKEHPNANKSNHSVSQNDEPPPEFNKHNQKKYKNSKIN